MSSGETHEQGAGHEQGQRMSRRQRHDAARAGWICAGGIVERKMTGFTHFDAAGNAAMVDVSAKPVTDRTATARARVTMQPRDRRHDPCRHCEEGRRAGRGAHRRHHGGQAHGGADPALPSAADHRRDPGAGRRAADAVEIAATVRTTGQTGVEMEALTAASVAALTCTTCASRWTAGCGSRRCGWCTRRAASQVSSCRRDVGPHPIRKPAGAPTVTVAASPVIVSCRARLLSLRVDHRPGRRPAVSV